MRRTGVSLAVIAAVLTLPVAAHAATYTVAAGAPPKTKAPASFAQGLYDSDEFYPGSKKPLKVHVGDTVKFVGGFHTASILGAGVKRSSFFLIQPGAAGELYSGINDGANQPFSFNGQQKFVYNTATLGPSGGPNVSSKATTYNSGVLFASPKGYSMKFTKAGRYQIVCLIHSAMNGTVDVVAPGKKVDTPAQAAKQGQEEANADVVEAINLHLNQPVSVADPKNAVMSVGAGTKNFSLFAFYPQALSVKAGTTITFKMGGPNEVHNVGFGPFGVQTAFILATDLIPLGPPGAPNQAAPALIYGTDPAVNGVYTFSGNTQHGNGLFATQAIDLDSGTPQLPSSVKVTVTTPGVYTLICQIHPNMSAMLDVHA